MKGDIAFAGFVLTADEWQALDAESRAQLIAVATRRIEPLPEPRRRLAEGTGPHEVLEVLDAELDELLEPDPDDVLERTAAAVEASSADESAPPAEDCEFEDFSDLNEP